MDISDLVIEGAGQEFKLSDFNQLLGPGVYVLIHRGRSVYVGMAKNILRRLSSSHHKRDAFL